MQRQGYRSRAVSVSSTRWGCVNAKSKLFFLEGQHLLVMAQILCLPSIPVIVNV